MFVTYKQGVTNIPDKPGTQEVSTPAVLLNTAQPTLPRVLNDDVRLGPNGGLLYNCAPREVIGSVMFSSPSPFRTVVRADPTQFGPVAGVLVSKLQDTLCEVIHAGPVVGFRSLIPGARYYLGPRGTLVTLPLDKLSPSVMTYVHYIGFATYADTLIVAPTYPILKRAV